jgi:phosphomannomutase
METKEFTKINMTELGSSSYYPNALDDYVTQITSKIKFKKSLRVLVDCKADPVGTLIPVLFEKYGIRSTLFNDFFSGYKLSKSREEFFDHLRRGDYNFGLIFNVDNIEIVTKTERVHVGKDIEDVLHFLRG